MLKFWQNLTQKLAKLVKIILGKKSKFFPISLLKNGKFSPGKN
jgi:hypothetical protein